MFGITDGKGFHIMLENGVTISTQFGYGNYCENRNKENESNSVICENAEVAVWDKDGEWITKEIFARLGKTIDDDVKGYIDSKKWIKILNECEKYRA